MKTALTRIVLLCIVLSLLCAGCAFGQPKLNNIPLGDFTIVYDPDAPDYTQRAAQYLQAQILERTGLELPVCESQSGPYAHELLVGETDRPLSQKLDADTKNVEFAFLADENHVAMEGDYFIIAAAAYYFAETYITGKRFSATIPQEVSVCEPITEEATRFLFLIGDGMGFNHTKLFDCYPIPADVPYYDNETVFYGEYLPHKGTVCTSSLSGVTDSAAAATALACGYKTMNRYVGIDEQKNPVQSLTELAFSQGKAVAVMSTDQMTGATPAGFSAHADDRDNSKAILKSQADLLQQGVVITCGLDATKKYQQDITDTLAQLEQSENGFFLMYEEGHIDKYSHKWNLEGTFSSVIRFNQAIGVFMEYAFYHPDTFLLITADHETGGLMLDDQGKYVYNFDGHTAADVPIYAYGQGTEVFDGFSDENTEIPKVIAKLWGVEDFGME